MSNCSSCGAELQPGAAFCSACGTAVAAQAAAPEAAPAYRPVVAVAPVNVAAWAMWSHLSALGGLVFPFGNILGPLIIWLSKRDEIPEVNVEAKEAMNFQITMSGAGIILWFFSLLMTIFTVFLPRSAGSAFTILIGAIEAAGYFGLIALWIIFVTQASIATNKGGTYRYPYTIRFIK